MDSISATLIFAPMLAPIASELFGIHPIHFGIVFVVNMEIGYLMPPVATNLFVASAVFKKPFGQVTKAVMPTLGLTCLALVMIMFMPTFSLFSLNLRDGKSPWATFPWEGKATTVSTATVEGEPSKKAPSLKSLTGKMMEDMTDESEKKE